MAFLDSPDLGVHGPGIGMNNKRHELVASLFTSLSPLFTAPTPLLYTSPLTKGNASPTSLYRI